MRRFLTILFFLLIAISAQAQVLFKAEVNARNMVIGNTVRYSVTMENLDSRTFKPPSFEGFNVVSGPSTSMSSTTINGVTTSEFRYTYVLEPKAIGEYTIPAATAMHNNKPLKSNLVKVIVQKGKGGEKTQGELSENMKSKMFVRAVPSSDTAYVGQQVILNYNIYYNTNVQRFDQTTEPEYEGFYRLKRSLYSRKKQVNSRLRNLNLSWGSLIRMLGREVCFTIVSNTSIFLQIQ